MRNSILSSVPMDPLTRVRTMLGLANGSFDGREEDRIFENYYQALTVYAVPRSRVIAIVVSLG